MQFTYDQLNVPVLVTTPDTSEPIARNLNEVTTVNPKDVSTNSTGEKSALNAKVTENLVVNSTLAKNPESDVNGTLAREEARRLEQQNLLNNRILFTRRGFYSLVESRLDA